MKKFITIVLILILCTGAIAAVWYFSGGFGGATPTAIVKYDGKSYLQSADLGEVRSGAEFEVYAIGDYEIRIEAQKGSDLAFTVGEEVYSWSDIAGKNFTKSFEIEKKNGGFTVKYSGLENILSSFFGTEVYVSETESNPIFDLIVESAASELRLSFSLSERVGAITVDPDQIIF